MEKKEKNREPKLSPTKINISITTGDGEQGIGSMSWNGEQWVLDERASNLLGDFLAGGRNYNGKIYTVQDHELYLPLTKSRYSGITFEASK